MYSFMGNKISNKYHLNSAEPFLKFNSFLERFILKIWENTDLSR